MKEIKKQTKGITLIALVITIIVLLILAGVSIAMLTGQNGILTQAKKADVETRGAAVEEARDLWKTNQELDSKSNSSTTQSLEELVKELENQGLLINDEPEQILTNGQVTIGSRTISFATTLVDAFKNGDIKIGDYISYNPIATGDTGTEEKYRYLSSAAKNGDSDQLFTVNNNTEKVNWIVLGLSDDGNSLLIITGIPVRKEGNGDLENDDPSYTLQGSAGYINSIDELNNISKVYGNGDFAKSARSFTVEDVNKLTGFNFGNFGNLGGYDDESAIDDYGVEVTVKGNGDGTYSYTTSNGLSGTFTRKYDEGYFYIEDNQVKNISKTDTTTEVKFENTGYWYEKEDFTMDEDLYNKFFGRDEDFFFLASRWYYTYSGVSPYGIFYLEGYGDFLDASYNPYWTDGNEQGYYGGVRPVIELKPETTINNLEILPEQTEPSWSDNFI